ncbi:tripartite tricarboxylate transporter substrate binding protein [Bordetella petrii]|uniref:tripartite tricarboxylate transporter substrate binding protein n=1 Tax=Bordetella petrii TaxID=94624 RepID=UPI001A96DE32|nr:tripartite tricarboxylate transporter substrate binding protein [Bordetella petrii]MBO1113839.1 tripartite tricarboxylate transporter substrate binding protein [Bordetella petrii]
MAKILPLLAIAAAAVHPQAQADAYPRQPINLIVNFPPGGATDLTARALGQAMTESLKQPVIIENRAGAGGAIGIGAISSARPDGYHVGFVSVAGLTTLPQMRRVPYSMETVTYLCRAYDAPVFMLVTQDSKFKSAQELVAYAKGNPGRLNYATVGPGSLPHLAALDFAAAAKIDISHIPYQGEAPAITDLLGGHVDLYFGTNAVATAHNLRRLAVAAEARQDDAPDTPTLAELGYPVRRSIGGGLIAPAGLDSQAEQALGQACKTAVLSQGFKQALGSLKLVPAYLDGAAFKRELQAEAGGNRKLLEREGLLAK